MSYDRLRGRPCGGCGRLLGRAGHALCASCRRRPPKPPPDEREVRERALEDERHRLAEHMRWIRTRAAEVSAELDALRDARIARPVLRAVPGGRA